jgi:hypothetical protein
MPPLSNPISEIEAVIIPSILQNKTFILNTFSYNQKYHSHVNNIYKLQTYVIVDVTCALPFLVGLLSRTVDTAYP